ncbi:MAG: transcriptional regulator [Gammaproteobacteria bacterium]|nr:transcriptional regulator [Gammaproteobacteria bacterium]
MSKLGKKLIGTIKDAKKKGLISLEATPDIASLRKKLHLSQHQFAKTYFINPETLKKWEQHKRIPDSISRAYLKCIAEEPDTIGRIVNS